jgi:hypothetical protein
MATMACMDAFMSSKKVIGTQLYIWHGRVHAKLKKVIGTQIYGGMYASTPSLKRHWNTNTQWHGRVHAKLKKSLEHKYIRHGRVRAKLKSHWNIDIQIFVFQ